MQAAHSVVEAKFVAASEGFTEEQTRLNSQLNEMRPAIEVLDQKIAAVGTGKLDEVVHALVHMKSNEEARREALESLFMRESNISRTSHMETNSLMMTQKMEIDTRVNEQAQRIRELWDEAAAQREARNRGGFDIGQDGGDQQSTGREPRLKSQARRDGKSRS